MTRSPATYSDDASSPVPTLQALSRTLQSAPKDRAGLLNLARLAARLDDLDTARQVMAGLTELYPTDSDIWVEAARVHRHAGDLSACVDALTIALTQSPDHRDGWTETALLADQRGDHRAAAALFGAIVEKYPTDAAVVMAAAYYHRRRNDHETSRALWRKMTHDHRGQPLGWVGLGVAHHNLGDFRAADNAFQTALSIAPDCAPAHFSRAFTLLSQRRWVEGFDEFRWRALLPNAPRAAAKLPPFTGSEPLGTQVLIWNDQGLGDAIQFLRFVPLLTRIGLEPILVLNPALVALIGPCADIGTVAAQGDTLPCADVQVALCDLPHHLKLADPDCAASHPYLAARPDRVPLPPRTPGRRRIGLAWAGAGHHDNDRNRSMTVTDLDPLLGLDGIDWYSLQVGPRAAEALSPRWAGRLQDLSGRLHDFADTAAVIAQLDLVITVDTSVAHLAGAMGHPTWLMLPKRCDWRWAGDDDQSRWYPSVRLFRQRHWNDWPTVVARIAKSLSD